MSDLSSEGAVAGTRLKAAAFVIFLLMLFFIPLLYIPFAFDSFVLSKQTIFEAVVFLLLGMLGIAACLGERLRVAPTPLTAFILLFLLWSALSIVWSAAPRLSMEESWHLAMLFLFFIVVRNFLDGNRAAMLLSAYVLAAASLAVAVQVLIQDFRFAFMPDSLVVRSVLGDWRDAISLVAFGNTSHIADFLVFGFIVTACIYMLARSRWLVLTSAASLWLHAAGLIVSWSVHSNLSLILSALLFGWLLRPYWREFGRVRIARRAALAVAGFAVVVAFYTIDHPLNPHGSAVWAPTVETGYLAAGEAPPSSLHGGIFSQAFASPRWTEGLDSRLAIWLTSLEMIRNHTLLGSGAGTYTYVYPATRSQLLEASPKLAMYAGNWTNAAHNEPLQTWAELGIVGLFLLAMMVAISLKRSIERLKLGVSPGNAVVLAGGAVALVALCLQAQMNFPLQLPASSMVFFLLLGVPYLLPTRGDEEGGLNVPVRRVYGPFEIGVVMHNMAYPSQLSVSANGAARWLLAPIVVVAAGFGIHCSLVPLRADIAFRTAREIQLSAVAGVPGADPQAMLAASRRALAIWPHHVDCRSAMQDMLLRVGDDEGVIEQTPLVLEKLNATEVYMRRAVALDALARTREADADWDVAFGRQPELAQQFPAAFRRYLLRQKAPATP